MTRITGNLNTSIFNTNPSELRDMLSHDAPPTVLEHVSRSLMYRATVARPDGITGNDFISVGRRFAALCTFAYGGQSVVELTLNKGQGDTYGSIPERGKDIPLDGLTEPDFEELFAAAKSMSLDVKPVKSSGSPRRKAAEQSDVRWGNMLWRRGRGQELELYAQAGDRGDEAKRESSVFLLDTLANKMFFVPDSLPDGLTAQLGYRGEGVLKDPNIADGRQGILARALATVIPRNK